MRKTLKGRLFFATLVLGGSMPGFCAAQETDFDHPRGNSAPPPNVHDFDHPNGNSAAHPAHDFDHPNGNTPASPANQASNGERYHDFEHPNGITPARTNQTANQAPVTSTPSSTDQPPGMRWVEAHYETRLEVVVVTPAHTEKREIPGGEITRTTSSGDKVITQLPAHTENVNVPAVTEKRPKQVLVPGRWVPLNSTPQSR